MDLKVLNRRSFFFRLRFYTPIGPQTHVSFFSRKGPSKFTFKIVPSSRHSALPPSFLKKSISFQLTTFNYGQRMNIYPRKLILVYPSLRYSRYLLDQFLRLTLSGYKSVIHLSVNLSINTYINLCLVVQSNIDYKCKS